MGGKFRSGLGSMCRHRSGVPAGSRVPTRSPVRNPQLVPCLTLTLQHQRRWHSCCFGGARNCLERLGPRAANFRFRQPGARGIDNIRHARKGRLALAQRPAWLGPVLGRAWRRCRTPAGLLRTAARVLRATSCRVCATAGRVCPAVWDWDRRAHPLNARLPSHQRAGRF
jgi:hypothetical protein